MKVKLRIALRQEGKFYNAYAASGDTMQGAFLLGSIAMGAVQKHPVIKEAFIDLMKQVVATGIKETTGEVLEEWFTRPAPESERGGSA
jgi:hypothetical protein